MKNAMVEPKTMQEFNRAVAQGDLEAVRQLTSDVPALVAHSTILGSGLHIAAEYGRVAIAELLLARGAELNLEAQVGGTPLQVAATAGNLDVIRFLVEKGADLSVPRPDRNPLVTVHMSTSSCGAL